ncbi:CAP domain-containing protein [Paracoccus sp. T5]
MPRDAGLTPIILISLMASLPVLPAFAQEPANLDKMRDAALELTNASRGEAGLETLTRSDVLDEAAQTHAADMLERDYYDHVTPEGQTPFDRFLSAGGNNWAVNGENIATCTGCSTPPDLPRVEAFHDGWMQSPEHRDNIMSQGFDSFGFGIAGKGSTVYAVQTFSGPGEDEGGTGSGLGPEEAADAAVQQINEARSAKDLAPLEQSKDLNEVAARVLERLAQDPEALPQNVFDLLPEGATGWTSLALQSATVGGSGASVGRQDLAGIISDWEDAGGDQVLGGMNASHVGFAAEAAGDGRLSAVAVFGGR